MPNKRNLRIDRKRNPYTTTKNASPPLEEEDRTEVSRRKADQKRNLLWHLAQQALESYMTGRPQMDHLPGIIHLNFLRRYRRKPGLPDLAANLGDRRVVLERQVATGLHRSIEVWSAMIVAGPAPQPSATISAVSLGGSPGPDGGKSTPAYVRGPPAGSGETSGAR